MDPATVAVAIPFLSVAAMYVLRGLKQVNQWEQGLKFTLGKYSGPVHPGLNFVPPIFARLIKVDTRIRNRDLPQQMVITRDNVTAMIDAVVYYKVVDPEKAALNVENFELAVKDRAKVVLRDVVGEITLDELLGHRDQVASKVKAAVEQFVSKWGLHVELIALQDVALPPKMQEAIAQIAVAERNKKAVIIKSQADLESAENFAQAARILSDSPGSMELRRLEALQNISGQGNSKVIFDLAKPFDNDERRRSIGVAAALSTEAPVRRGVRVTDESAQAEAEEVADELQAEGQKLGRR